MSLRLLTLNIHGEPGGRDEGTLPELVRFVLSESPDVIALQEVCQTRDAARLSLPPPDGYFAAESGVILREDLFVCRLAAALSEKGSRYAWSYLPIKLGYGKYDEGVALLSRRPIEETEALTVSRTADQENWRTRRLLGARIGNAWFYSVHFGWFDDPEEPFSEQWERARAGFLRHGGQTVWLMGDFNSPAEADGGGYALVRESGYHDAWQLAKDEAGATVCGGIDGWEKEHGQGLRIDQIWCSRRLGRGSARRVFDGREYAVVSDHFGVLIEHEGG